MPNKFRGCVGGIKTNLGSWYTPNDQDPSECTYCEWCLQNGCFKKEDTYQLDDVYDCNCPNIGHHGSIDEYFCQRHINIPLHKCGLFDCLKCERCFYSDGRNISAIGVKLEIPNYCYPCSTFEGICRICGEKEQP